MCPPKRSWTEREGRLSELTYDAVTRAARTAGRIGPLRRALANHAERKIRARADHPDPRHPAAVEQDKNSATRKRASRRRR